MSSSLAVSVAKGPGLKEREDQISDEAVGFLRGVQNAKCRLKMALQFCLLKRL